MIYGIGIDLIEIERIAKLINKDEQAFFNKIFTEAEKEGIPSKDKRKVEYIAGRFTAKEAFAKAYGTGIGKDIGWKDIEILQMETGKPFIKVNKLKEASFIIHLSIAHSSTMAVSKVIIEQM